LSGSYYSKSCANSASLSFYRSGQFPVQIAKKPEEIFYVWERAVPGIWKCYSKMSSILEPGTQRRRRGLCENRRDRDALSVETAQTAAGLRRFIHKRIELIQY
jgi:hypothetical protein